MTAPSVAVIIRTRGDRPAMLRAAVASVAAQTYPNVMAIVVWDVPLDAEDPYSTHERYTGQVPGVGRQCEYKPGHYISAVFESYPGRCGRAAAANHGIDSGPETPFVMFLDDDDTIEPTHVANLYDAVRDDPDRMVAYSDAKIMHCDAENRPLRQGHVYRWPFTIEQLRVANQRPLNAFLFRREVFNLERFDPTDEHCEDWSLLLRLAKRGVGFVHAPGVTAIYNQRGDGGNSLREEMLRWSRIVRDKHGK
jgi:GT2 family glycosyltransferase